MQVIDQALELQCATSDISCTACAQLLTSREREVVLTLGRGLKHAQVADMLFISVKTVSTHKRTAMRKLGFRRTHELQQWVRNELDYELKQKIGKSSVVTLSTDMTAYSDPNRSSTPI